MQVVRVSRGALSWPLQGKRRLRYDSFSDGWITLDGRETRLKGSVIFARQFCTRWRNEATGSQLIIRGSM
jgi:hypothetical protein